MSETFTCPRRLADGRTAGRFPGDAENIDCWNKGQCSYDGSLHPDVFMEYVRSGKKVGSTDKGYKFYMDEYEGPVRGAKKFYTHHLSPEQSNEFFDHWMASEINFGDYPPYVPIFLPGISPDRIEESRS